MTHVHRVLALSVSVALFSPLPEAIAQVPTVVLQEGGTFNGANPGEVITSLTFVEVTGKGGYATSASSTDGVNNESLILGNFNPGAPGVLRRPQTIGQYQQNFFGIQIGLGDNSIAYDCRVDDLSGPGTDLSAIYVDGTLVAVEDSAVPSFPGWDWGIINNGTVGLTENGTPYWRMSLSQGANNSQGVFTGLAATPTLMYQQAVPNLAGTIDWWIALNNEFHMSSQGGHHICIAYQDAPGSSFGLVVDGAGAFAGSNVIQTGELVDPAAGGQNSEQWTGLLGVHINESGQWTMNARTNGIGTEYVQVQDGAIVRRELDVQDGVTLGDRNGYAKMNDDGDCLYHWQLSGGGNPGALWLNGDLIAVTGDLVDSDGDGIPEQNANLDSLIWWTKMDLSNRDGTDHVDVYYESDVLVPGDDLHTLLHQRVYVGPLRMGARPALATSGQTLTLRARGGTPSTPALLYVTKVNGAPILLKLAKVNFDADGCAVLSGAVPGGLGSVDLEVIAMGLADNGKVAVTNAAPVFLR